MAAAKSLLAGMKILLAEDNATNQMVAVQMLEVLGASVVLAEDGAEALDMLRAQSFDAALIDIEMPKLSGIDLIQIVRRSEPPLCDLPMAALTAYVMANQRKAIEMAGADGVIAKPILAIEGFGSEVLTAISARVHSIAQRAECAAPNESARTPSGGNEDIDRAVFEELLASFDTAGRAELLTKLREDVSTGRNRIREALSSADMVTIESASHALISVAGIAGAVRLATLCRQVNGYARSGENRPPEQTVDQLVEAADRFLDFVQTYEGP